LASKLPPGPYHLGGELTTDEAERAALGWALGSYRFSRYKKAPQKLAELAFPPKIDRKAVRSAADATFLVRDLVTTPANDMGPEELADAAKALGKAHSARVTVTTGAQL